MDRRPHRRTPQHRDYAPILTAQEALSLLNMKSSVSQEYPAAKGREPEIVLGFQRDFLKNLLGRNWEEKMDKGFDRPLIQAESNPLNDRGNKHLWVFKSDLEHLVYGPLTPNEASIFWERTDPVRPRMPVARVNGDPRHPHLMKQFREEYMERILGPAWQERLEISGISFVRGVATDVGAQPVNIASVDVAPFQTRRFGHAILPVPAPEGAFVYDVQPSAAARHLHS